MEFGWESSDVVSFDLSPPSPLQGQTWIAKLESAYNAPIISPSVLRCETDLYTGEKPINLYCSVSEFRHPVNFVTCHLNPQKPALLVFKYM